MSNFKAWRLELFFKSQNQLQDKVVPFLREHGISRMNITNKSKDDDLLASVQLLSDVIPGSDVCVHYSIKQQYVRSEDASFQRLHDFCSKLHKKSSPQANRSLMLLSGGGKKKALCTVKALQRAASDEASHLAGPIHVAFNPYLPGAAEQHDEQQRLRQKLDSGLVAGVWLQFGSDTAMLREGLQFLQQNAPSGLAVYGSVFLPSKKLLAQMRYRPWSGVYLSHAWLLNVDAATHGTREVLELYRQHNVTPLIESNVTTKEELKQVYDLLHV